MGDASSFRRDNGWTTFGPGVRSIVISAFFFTAMTASVKHLQRLPFDEIVFVRAFVTALITGGMLVRRGGSLIGARANRPLLLARGLTGSLALVLYFVTLQQVPLGLAVTLQYLAPLFTMAMASVAFNEPLRWYHAIVFPAALAGVALIQSGCELDFSSAVIIGVASALCSAISYNCVRGLQGRENPLTVIFYFPLVALPCLIWQPSGQWALPDLAEWGMLLAMSLSATAGQYFQTKAYQARDADRVATFAYSTVLVSFLAGAVLFDEPVSPSTCLGAALVVGSIVFAQLQPQGLLVRGASVPATPGKDPAVGERFKAEIA